MVDEQDQALRKLLQLASAVAEPEHVAETMLKLVTDAAHGMGKGFGGFNLITAEAKDGTERNALIVVAAVSSKEDLTNLIESLQAYVVELDSRDP